MFKRLKKTATSCKISIIRCSNVGHIVPQTVVPLMRSGFSLPRKTFLCFLNPVVHLFRRLVTFGCQSHYLALCLCPPSISPRVDFQSTQPLSVGPHASAPAILAMPSRFVFACRLFLRGVASWDCVLSPATCSKLWNPFIFSSNSPAIRFRSRSCCPRF